MLELKAGLIGAGIAASQTPLMHEAEGRALGLNYRYARMDTNVLPFAELGLNDLIVRAEEEGYSGLNITHPFKIEAVALMDRLDGVAAELGAINTVVFSEGRRIGHNTDYTGFLTALQRDLPQVSRKHVALFGAGGAGLAAALALLDWGVEQLFVVDTDPRRAAALAKHMQALRSDASVVAQRQVDVALIDGLVNATPVGMESYPGAVMDPRALSPDCWVADLVYFPLQTELLRQARAFGLQVMSGASTALFQAVHAFALMTGRTPNAARMQAQLSQALKRAE